MIWIYSSVYALALAPLFWLDAAALRLLGKRLIAGTLVSGLVFLLLPAELGHRPMQAAGGYAAAYRLLYALDLPNNTVPSLHIISSALIALAIVRAATPVSKAVFGLWLALITLSVLLVHQHHLLDVVAAYAVVALLQRLIRSPIGGRGA
jgi:hypothetical protein